MCGEVCVVVETLRGGITDITFVMLAGGRRLAEGLQTKLTALLLGHHVQKLAGELGAADRVVCIEHDRLAEFNPEAYLRVTTALFEQHKPRIVLLGHTATGTDLACGLARRLQAPIVAGCRTFSVDDGTAQYSALICGGKLIATGPLPEPTCVATMMSGGYKADEGRGTRTPAIETLTLPAGLDRLRVNFKRYIEPPTGDVDIAKEAILVSVGRGIQNKDNIALVEELAKALGGAVSGSRPVIDQEWLPTTRLVGKSGKQVKPKLYLALGISGAPEHAEGMRDAELIVAINRDPKAPIYGLAHYGAVVDVLELVPKLTTALQRA